MKKKDFQNMIWQDKIDTMKCKKKLYNEVKNNPNQFIFVHNVIRAKFKKQFKGNIRYKLINQKSQILVGQHWKILITDAAHKQQWKIVFENMTQSYVKCLRVVGNTHAYKQILIDLAHPIFSSLHTLNLATNRIDNIQALSFIQLPRLSRICLQNNLVSKCSAFNKAKIECLQTLNVSFNYIQTIDIGRILTGKQKNQFSIIYNDWQRQGTAVQDIRYRAKQQRGKKKRQINYSFRYSLDGIRLKDKIQQGINYIGYYHPIFINQSVYHCLMRKFSQKQKQK